MAGQFKNAIAVSVSIIALGTALPAHAQDNAVSDGDTAESAGIGEIIVTSQRREENLQDVPISVSAFTGEQILARGTFDIGRLEGLVPGFTFGRSGSDARPAIRGVRTENVGVNGDTTIGFFVDGIYQSRASQATTGFVDIERVEVQRGPQGTLYGRNTFGGNIEIRSARPKLGDLLGGADVHVGEFGRFRTDAFVNVPLDDTLAVRLCTHLSELDVNGSCWSLQELVST